MMEPVPCHVKTPTFILRTRTRFRASLLQWFDSEKRDLPWRNTGDPYRIWVSEVMLQQTRVEAVKAYYARFLKAFPTLTALAQADEQQVLAEWSGLGYYRRARMLQTAAKQLSDAGEEIPSTSCELEKLPGIGRYTAAAIASIAFGEPVAVVDGNVERVIDRICGCGETERAKPDYWSTAQSWLDKDRPGDFNQAMMELGATVCLPKNPNCGKCPVRGWCGTRGELEIPVKAERRKANLHYLLSVSGKRIALIQRAASESKMGGMWELPSVGRVAKKTESILRLRHSITDTDYVVRVWRGKAPIACDWIQLSEANSVALTGLTRKILQRLNLVELR